MTVSEIFGGGTAKASIPSIQKMLSENLRANISSMCNGKISFNNKETVSINNIRHRKMRHASEAEI